MSSKKAACGQRQEMAAVGNTAHFEQAIEDRDLANQVAEHKSMFFGSRVLGRMTPRLRAEFFGTAA